MEKLKILELFAGIGACSTALKRIGMDVEIVDAVEIDKYAMASFNAIHETNFEVQDIVEYDKVFEDLDLITHGSPCQDFSVAGKQAGGDLGSGTRSSLMYETIRIVGQNRPKYVLWENVKNVLSKKHKHNFDNYINTMNTLGYNSYYQVLNAKDYGIPQNRERVYTISIRRDIDKGNFKFPEKEELTLRLKDMLEDKVDEKYYLSKEISSKYIPVSESGNVKGKLVMDKWQDNMKRIYDIEKYSPALNTMQGGNTEPKIIEDFYRNRPVREYKDVCPTLRSERIGLKVIGNYMPSNHDASRIVDSNGLAPTVKENHGTVTATNVDYKIRKLTPKECWRLMGFADEDFEKAQNIPTSNTQLYKQAGNSIVVDVLEKIFKNLFEV